VDLGLELRLDLRLLIAVRPRESVVEFIDLLLERAQLRFLLGRAFIVLEELEVRLDLVLRFWLRVVGRSKSELVRISSTR